MGRKVSLARSADATSRGEVQRRDGGRCVLCGGAAGELHEIVPRSRWGASGVSACFAVKNRVSLCQTCHREAHTRPARIRLLRYLREVYDYDYSESPFSEYGIM